jgi:ubiquitin C-terminal hydrolase
MDQLCGFNNMGNTCYMNAALQIITNSTVLTKIMLTNNFVSPKLNIYKNFLQSYKNGQPFGPIEVKHMVGQKDSKFMDNSQHDSHEFLIHLMEILEDEFKKEYNEDQLTIFNIPLNEFMSRIFDTNVSSIIYCEETDEKSKTKVGEKILSLPIPKNDKKKVSLNDCLDYYTQIEKLSGDAQWKSVKENKLVDAYKRLYLKSLPKYLLIQLKRFSFFSFSNKNDIDVSIPINLDIRNNSYQLRGIIYHMGSANGGHYVAIIYHNDEWYLCDDSNISKISDINKYLDKGYTYLYVKNK